MKIQKMQISNFMGLSGSYTYELPQLAAIVGPNGTGKTTIMNAIRFGLSGLEPEGSDIINKSASECRVILTFSSEDGFLQFERRKYREKPSRCLINGATTTKKTLDEKLSEVIGIPVDKVKVLSCADLVANMKPQEFASFILGYIPEKMNRDEVIALIPKTTPGMIDIFEATMPEEVDLEVIDDFDKISRTNRKALKEELAGKETLYATKPKEATETTREEIEKALAELAGRESGYKVYVAKKAAYDRAVENAAKHAEKLKALKEEIESIEADRPDTEKYKDLLKEKEATEDSIRNQSIAIESIKAAIAQMQASLEDLDKPVCPLSELIVCTQDKSGAKAELEASIESSKEGVKALEKELTKADEKLKELETAIKAYQDNYQRYDKRIALSKQYKSFEAAKPEVPPLPEEVTPVDVAAERAELEAELKLILAYEEGLKLKAKIETLKIAVSDYEACVKAVAEKGPVRTGVISKYLKVFEDICNERSSKVRPEITFEFVAKDGVVVLMDNGKGSKLSYDNLSGGERAYMLFILMDMLNSLVGTRLLIMDELSVIDTKCFEALLDLVVEYASDYDHILLAAVNHDDTVASIKAKGIPELSIGSDESIPF